MYHIQSLDFIENTWHLMVVVVVFFMGLYIALAQYRLFRVNQHLATTLYFYHTILCLYYMTYSYSHTADSTHYFLESQTFVSFPTIPGTQAIIFLTSLFTQYLHFSYGAVFLVFNIVGFMGLLALASSIFELTHGAVGKVRTTVFCVMFLPGASFWSAAIGKDAITFLGAGMACFASIDLVKRYPLMICAVLATFIARPHMAALMLLSITLALLTSKSVSFKLRILLVLATIPSGVYTLILAKDYVGLGSEISIVEIGDYVATRQSANTEGRMAVDISNMSVASRMVTYLYRPLFSDGGGLLAMIVSIENLILIFLTGIALYLSFTRRKCKLQSVGWWFLVLYAFFAWLVLANTTANLGIAIRQKWMFLPMIFTLCFSYIGRHNPVQKRVHS